MCRLINSADSEDKPLHLILQFFATYHVFQPYWLSTIVFSGGSRISQTGTPIPKLGAKTYCLARFCMYLAKPTPQNPPMLFLWVWNQNRCWETSDCKLNNIAYDSPDQQTASVNGRDFCVHIGWTTLYTWLCLTGKFGITASYAIMFLIAAEIFPTVVRWDHYC